MSRQLKSSCSIIYVLDMHVLVFKLYLLNLLFLLQVCLKLQKDSQLCTTSNKVIILKYKSSGQMEKTPWQLIDRFVIVNIVMHEWQFQTDYWDLPVSASNQRLSSVSDEQKTSVTETTVSKSVLNWEKKNSINRTTKELDMKFPRKQGKMMDAKESNNLLQFFAFRGIYAMLPFWLEDFLTPFVKVVYSFFLDK